MQAGDVDAVNVICEHHTASLLSARLPNRPEGELFNPSARTLAAEAAIKDAVAEETAAYKDRLAGCLPADIANEVQAIFLARCEGRIWAQVVAPSRCRQGPIKASSRPQQHTRGQMHGCTSVNRRGAQCWARLPTLQVGDVAQPAPRGWLRAGP